MAPALSSCLFLLIIGFVACSNYSTAAPPQASIHPAQFPGEPAIPLEATLEQPQTPAGHQEPHQFGSAPDRDLFRLAKELIPGLNDIPRTLPKDSTEYSVGRAQSFWLIDLHNSEIYESDFTLAMVTPNAYWYVENNLDFSMRGLVQSASNFEENIYPIITKIFGTKRSLDRSDVRRLNILNAKLTNVAGYYSSTDEYPISVRPKSNQRKIIYINAYDITPGSANYDLVLSHELQHVIHWTADPSEDTWVNEGLSELASSIVLKSAHSINHFLQEEPVSLVHWPTSSSGSQANYGAASLFMHFFTEHYGGRNDLSDLLAQPEDGLEGIDQYLANAGYEANFNDVFKQWAVANILDEHIQTNSKILGYDNLEITVEIVGSISNLKTKRFEVPQYAVAYTELKSISEPVQLSFRGNTEVALLPVQVGPSGCWWSNSGDSIDSTLSYHVGTHTGSLPALEYEVWFEIEEDWDYVYVEVSVDDGEKWQIVETPRTSSTNPLGNAFGAGYTGSSGGWLSDSIDLTPFAYDDIWVRFQYVTDDAINHEGACFRSLPISHAGTYNEGVWQAHGFAFTDNVVSQDFQVQLITVGKEPQVQQLRLDSSNSGTWAIQPPKDGERLIVAVASLAEKTRELANYTLSLRPLN